MNWTVQQIASDAVVRVLHAKTSTEAEVGIVAVIAAAEERGRRSGVEEEHERWKYSQRVIAILVQRQDNIVLISKAEQERLDPRIVIETVVKHDGTLMIRLARDLSESALAGDKAESALAPRDPGDS